MHPFETQLLRRLVASTSYSAILGVLADAHRAVPCSKAFMSQLASEVRQARARIDRNHLDIVTGAETAIRESRELLSRYG